ncbi:YtoQ family protein [Aliidiomarina quisquiliarum]
MIVTSHKDDEQSDIAIVRFGDTHKHWNAAFDDARGKNSQICRG